MISNRLAVEETGEPLAVREQGFLESALGNPKNRWHYGETDVGIASLLRMAWPSRNTTAARSTWSTMGRSSSIVAGPQDHPLPVNLALRISGIVLGIVANPLLALRFHSQVPIPGQCSSRMASCFFVIALASLVVAISYTPCVAALLRRQTGFALFIAFFNDLGIYSRNIGCALVATTICLFARNDATESYACNIRFKHTRFSPVFSVCCERDVCAHNVLMYYHVLSLLHVLPGECREG